MAKPDPAHIATNQELAALEKRIAAEYKKAADELTGKINAYFESSKKRDEETKALIGTIVNGREYTEQDYKQWRLAQIGRGKRFEALRDRIAERMAHANEVAAAYINENTPGIYSLNRNYAAYTIEQVAGDVGFDLWDEQTVKRLIVEQPDLMPYYPPKRAVKRGIDLAWGKRQITAQVTAGILQGESIKHLADRLQTNIPNMNRDSAIRAARTAITGAQNAGRQDSYDAAVKMGIEMEKQWLATLDGRTRHDHAAADGQTVAEDKPFRVGGYELMYPGDPRGPGHEIYNCRCTMIAKVKGADVSDAKRRAKGPETRESALIENMTYSEWAGRKESTNKVAGVEDITGVNVNPKNIVPINAVTDKDKFAALVYDFEHSGYSGRPIVVGNLGDGEYQALSGSHRIFAAREAGIDIPTVSVEYNSKTAKLFEAADDAERAAIAKKLYKSGSISEDAYRLISFEEESNLMPVSSEYADLTKKKAELYKAEQEAKAAAEKAAKEAAEAAKEKAAQEFAKSREESAEMAEYKAFLEEMNKKYGADNIWADMDDNEYDKMERLERIAYKGK